MEYVWGFGVIILKTSAKNANPQGGGTNALSTSNTTTLRNVAKSRRVASDSKPKEKTII